MTQVEKQKHDSVKYSQWDVYFWIISFIKPYKGTLFFLVLCGLVVGGVEVVIPKFIQYFIDHIIPTQNVDLFKQLLVGLSGLILVMIMFMGVRNILERRLREKAAKDLQYNVFQQIRLLGYSYFESTSIGDNLTLMNTDVSAIQDIYRSFLPGVIWRSLFAIVSIAVMFSMNMGLTLVTLGCLVLYYLVGPLLEKKVSEVNDVAYAHMKDYQKHIYDSVASATEVRAYNSQNWIMDRFRMKYRMYSKHWLRRSTFIYSSEAIRHLTFNLGAVALFIYGTFLVQQSNLQIGEFVAFILYYFSVLNIMASIISDVTQQKILMVQGEKLFRFCLKKPQVAPPVKGLEIKELRGEIEFENVSFDYPSKKDVLRNVNFNVHAGERVALVGVSGGGKTSILKLVDRFYDPTSGNVKIDGIPINQLSLDQLRESIGYVFQENYLFGTTIEENIRFGNPSATDEEVIKAAKAAFIHDFIMTLPDTYKTYVGERGTKLSGGQKQRIAIARMLIKNPSIVLLDEATSALDPLSESEVQKALDQLLKGRTTIAIAHRLSTIKDYDKIILIENGMIAEVGTWDELETKRGAFYRLLKGSENNEQVVS